MTLNGYKLIEDHNLVKHDGYEKVKKTWREHICWRFWERYKLVPNYVPIDKLYVYDNIIIGHPFYLQELTKEFMNGAK